MFTSKRRPDRTMFFEKIFSWIFSVSENEQPYQWTLDSIGHKSKIFAKNTEYLLETQKRYQEKAKQSVKESLELVSSDGWKLSNASEYGTLYVKKHSKYGTLFKFMGTINKPAPRLINMLFQNVEKSPDWNICVSDAKVLLSIDENTNIARITTYRRPFVINRYFINLRYVTMLQDAYIHSSVSIDYPAGPENTQHVRGEQKFCTYVIRPIHGNPNASEVTWLLHTNLKGQLPQWIVDRTMWTGIFDHIMCIHKMSAKLK